MTIDEHVALERLISQRNEAHDALLILIRAQGKINPKDSEQYFRADWVRHVATEGLGDSAPYLLKDIETNG